MLFKNVKGIGVAFVNIGVQILQRDMPFDAHQVRRVHVDQDCFIFNILFVEKILYVLSGKRIVRDMHFCSD